VPLARHIIVLLDGTNCAATRGLRKDLTNLFSIGIALNNQKILSETGIPVGEQVIFYFPGPGARTTIAAPIERAFGHGIESTIVEAYLAIANNLRDPETDRVYIFGYSRGAIAAKGLATLLAKSGLIRRNYLHRLKHAWDLYKGDVSAKVHLTDDIIHRVTVPFMGLFDPVLGPPTSLVDVPYSGELEDCVEFAVEIVAYDECRFSFGEELWSSDEPIDQDDVFARPLRSPRANLQQIWIPGAHSDIGGHQGDQLLGLISLLTMLERIQARAGLSLNPAYVEKQLNKLLNYEGVIGISSPWRYTFRGIPQLVGSVRRPMKSAATYLHPVISMLDGQTIRLGKKKRAYRFRDGDISDYNNYSFELSEVFPNRANPGVEIGTRILDILSQLE